MRPRWRTALAALLLTAGTLGAQAPAESGAFRLHKVAQPIGEESYRIAVTGGKRVLTDSFAFTDRGTRVPLQATLVTDQRGTPALYSIRGRTSRQSVIADSVAIAGPAISLWSDTTRLPDQQLATGELAFPIASYAPVAVQQELLRYWQGHGRPASLRTLPSGAVRIAERGSDTLTLAARRIILRRYSVNGLIWGQETLWLDASGKLAAVVGTDAEFDHFEAVRDTYEPLLPRFIARAGSDGAAVLAGLAGLRPPRGRFALVGATLIDGLGGPPVPHATVLVDSGRILDAGPSQLVPVPAGMPVVDLDGQTILPGLWDMHAHYEQVEWGPIYLAAGVTTVRDVGNEFDFITAVRDAIAKGRGIGPRILAAGIIDGPGPNGIGVMRAATPAEAVELVDRYADAGFQQIKIYSSVTLPVIEAITKEAHRIGLTVTGHIPTGLTGYQGVEAGMDQINHISYVLAMMKPPRVPGQPVPPLDLGSAEAKRAIAFLQEHRTVLDPTLATFELAYHPASVPVSDFEPGVTHVAPELAAQFAGSGVPAARAEAATTQFQEMIAAVGALHQAGIPIVAGTDQTVPGYSLHRELELYVAAGFTPMEAILAATVIPARIMHLDHEVGTITKGMRADLLVVAGHPLERIEDLRRVTMVIADGRRYDPAPLWQSVGFLP